MTSKTFFKSSILYFAAMLFLAFAQHISATENTLPKNDTKSVVPSETGHNKDLDETAERRIIVYYFHGKTRCYTCKRIERLTNEAVQEFFDDEIDAGLVELKAINVDEKENTHFVKDYQLYTKSVVVSHIVKGSEMRWKNLQKVWELVHDEKSFEEYIRSEVEAYLS